ncbi:hypothetical protein Aconfl_33200 [Algoriphagus confluentis]|uniref:Uncharacterized protein n=1 Tax=Algoriphagus confluentis TaxID=1697556 RepID=A0ABQ6PRX5_9BACT|nr:hypothetical protein Aconfl_33200 [Algoriphagus confluentis]
MTLNGAAISLVGKFEIESLFYPEFKFAFWTFSTLLSKFS